MNKRLQATPCTFFSTDEKAALHDAGTERLQVFLQAHFAILTIVVSLTLSPELSRFQSSSAVTFTFYGTFHTCCVH